MLAAGNQLVVIDLGLVAGIEVGEEVVFSPTDDLGMPPAHPVGVEDDLTMLGRATDHGSLLLQLDDLSDGLAADPFQ